jgi:hypothetical protein
MKRYILSVCLLYLLVCAANAQNTIAKIKYEEAEEAFSRSDYSLVIIKIDEAEALLNGVNPKTLYLKILAKNQLLKADYSIIRSLKADCNYYLDNYESNEGVEDKYREIYKIFKDLSNSGDSDAEIIKNNEIIAAEFKSKERIKSLIDYANVLCQKFKFKPNLNREDFLAQNDKFNGVYLSRYDNGYYFGIPTISYTPEKSSLSIRGIYDTAFPSIITNSDDEVISFGINFLWGKNMFEQHLSEFNDIKKGLYDQFNKSNISEGSLTGGETILVKVPKSIDDPTTFLYIRFTHLHPDKKFSALNISFDTNEKIATFWQY